MGCDCGGGVLVHRPYNFRSMDTKVWTVMQASRREQIYYHKTGPYQNFFFTNNNSF